MTNVMDAPRITLLSPRSFAQGQPHDRFRGLRAYDPVHWHPEPAGPAERSAKS